MALYHEYQYGKWADTILWNMDFLLVVLFTILAIVGVSLWARTQWNRSWLLFISSRMILVVLILGGCFTWSEDRKARKFWNERLLSLAKGYALATENMRVDQIPTDPSSLENPLYLKLLGVFEQWQRQDEMVINVCVFRKDDKGDLIYVVRPGADYDADGLLIGDLEELAPPGKNYGPALDEPVLLNAYHSGKPQFTEFPYYASGLPWLYAAIPLHFEGKVSDFLFVVDFHAKYWINHVRNARRFPVLGTLLVVFLIQSSTIEIILLQEALKKTTHAKDRLAESELKYRKIIDNSHDSIALLQHGHFVYVNRKTCELFAMSSEELEGKGPYELSPPQQPDGRESSEKGRHFIGAALKGVPQVFEWTYLRHDQTPLVCEIHLDPLEVGGEMLLIAVSHDLSEQYRANEAEQEAKTKSRFLAHMSHEIRTPMTAILGYTELLLIDQLSITAPGKQKDITVSDCLDVLNHCRESITIIRSNAEFLLSILNDILDLSKIEAEKMTVEYMGVSSRPFLNELFGLYQTQAKGKGLSFSIRVLTPFPDTIYSDPVRIKQILINLIGNAIKFTSAGEVSVSVSWTLEDPSGSWKIPEISVQEDAAEEVNADDSPPPCVGKLVFAVEDSGIGMSPEQVESLFTPFHQADTSTTRKFGGTGLGLAISKRLTEMLGGSLAVSSRVESGSTFTLKIPQRLPGNTKWFHPEQVMQSPEPASPKEDRVQVKQAVKSLLQGIRVLLVEDGKDNQRLFERILMKAGAEVEIAENGKIALDRCLGDRSEDSPFDIILMDMQMPVMDGYTATRELRANKYEDPIIALTAHALIEEHEKCLKVGCDDYATKPIKRDELIDVILKNIGP